MLWDVLVILLKVEYLLRHTNGPPTSLSQTVCDSDVGGPFVCRNGGTPELHGVIGNGSPGGCDRPFYTVYTYTRVYEVKDWIDRIIG